jgi:Holliday junction resolvase RusA-like endonuclease
LTDLIDLFNARVIDEDEVTPSLTFCVWGHPEPAGSKRALPRKGAPGQFVVIDDNPKSKSWKRVVATMGAHFRDRAHYPIIEQAVGIRVTFLRERPKYHFRANGALRPEAPDYPDTKPDTTKLLRGVEDALTGVLWNDDAQIVDQHVYKRWSAREGVEITCWQKRPSRVRTWEPQGVGTVSRADSSRARPISTRISYSSKRRGTGSTATSGTASKPSEIAPRR